jgi:hypothetical protein
MAVLLAGTVVPGMPTAYATYCVSPAAPPPVAPNPCGRTCGFLSVTDPSREVGSQSGEIDAGPLSTGEGGTLVCSIHVNNDLHSGAAAAVHEVSTDVGVAVMAPRLLSYLATASDNVSLCTAWNPAGSFETWYFVGSASTTTGRFGDWTTNPDSSCGPALLTVTPNDPECGIWKAVDGRAGTNVAETWQDCEPYEPII